MHFTPKGPDNPSVAHRARHIRKTVLLLVAEIRARACEELESQGLMAPATPKGSESVFAEIPYRRAENITPLRAPAAVIHKAGATIAVSGDIPERLLSQIMKEVLHD